MTCVNPAADRSLAARRFAVSPRRWSVARGGVLCLALAGLPLAAAAAPEDGFTLGAGLAQTRDSNVFRLSDAASPLAVLGRDQRADRLTTLAVSAGTVLHLGRQALRLDARAARIDYATFGELDHHAGALTANWRWVAGNRLSGQLTLDRTRQLSGYEDFRPGAITRNLETVDRAEFAGDYWFHPDVHAEFGFDRRASENDSAARRSSDHVGDTARLGLRYAAASGTTLALRGRVTDGRYPNRVRSATLDTDYTQTAMELSLSWPVSAKSRLSGGLGHIARRYDVVQRNDFSGETWNLGWDWAAGGKTSLSVALGQQVSSQEDFAVNYARTTSVSISPRWQATDKLRLEASLLRARRDFKGDPALLAPGVPAREDVTSGAGLSLSYQPTRWLTLSTRVQHDRRTSNIVGVDYRVRTLGFTLDAAI